MNSAINFRASIYSKISAIRSRAFLRQSIPVFVGLLIGLPALFVGSKLPTAGLSAYLQTDYLSVRAKEDIVTSDLPISNVGISFSGEIRAKNGVVLTGDDLSIFLENTAETDLVVNSFTLSEHTTVSFFIDRRQNRIALTASNSAMRLRIIPNADTHIDVHGASCERAGLSECSLLIEGGEPLFLIGDSRTPFHAVFDAPSVPLTFTDQAVVDELQFWSIVTETADVAPRSGIHSGRLRFRETPDLQYNLENGEILYLVPDELTLRSLVINENEIEMHVSGVVRNAEVEIGNARHSIMPSWFQKLVRNPYVRMFFGALSIFLGVAISLFGKKAKRHG